MDSVSQKTDAYVTVTFGTTEPQRTAVAYKTLHPVWNQDFRIEVHDDIVLQDNLVQLKVFDKDVYSADMCIGVVYCDLSSLLLPNASNKIAGWFPIYDTLKGIRGRLLVVIRLQFFGDVNPFKDSAAGVSIFGISIPHRHCVHGIHGFVEELHTSDDPEYSWSDFFQTSQTSNESRQLLLYSLSSKIYRNVGRKALEVGGNSVLGFSLAFDMEGSSGGLVVRGFGTACTIHRIDRSPGLQPQPLKSAALDEIEHLSLDANDNPLESWQKGEQKEEQPSRLFSGQVQFLTLVSFPLDVHMRLGGVVSAKAVKHLGTLRVDQATRDSWWFELREEIKAHAAALNCSSVLGYTETTTIFEDICILTAYGTAANCGRLRTCEIENVDNAIAAASVSPLHGTIEKEEADRGDIPKLATSTELPNTIPKFTPQFSSSKNKRRGFTKKKRNAFCSSCHIPYTLGKAPFRMNLVACEICKKRYVPEILLTTIEPPSNLPIAGIGKLVEARVCRTKKKIQGEQNAILISEAIPFLEYDLHRQLIYKLRVLGMNAAFRLTWQISIGSNLIIGIASATAVYALPLPAPPVLKISRNIEVKDAEDADLFELQRKIMAISEENNEFLQESVSEWKQNFLKLVKKKQSAVVGMAISSRLSSVNVKLDRSASLASENNRKSIDTPTSSSESSSSDSENLAESDTNKLTFVLHIDDDADEDILMAILDPTPPLEVFLCNTEFPPGLKCEMSTVQMISCLRRVHWADSISFLRLNQQFASVFHDLYASLSFKAQDFSPCCISGVRLFVSLPSDNTIELGCTASILMLDEDYEWSKFEQKFEKMHDSLTPFLLPPGLKNPFAKQKSTISCIPSVEEKVETDAVVIDIETEHLQQESIASLSVKRELELEPLNDVFDETFVELTPLSSISQSSVQKFLGRVQVHLIKESWTFNDEGGLGQFAHLFLSEAQAIARANVAARGGNALLGYRLHECRFIEPSKNQAYSIISLSGDAVLLERHNQQTMMGIYLQNKAAQSYSNY